MKQALAKVRAAQQCHPNAVMTLLCEADELLDQAIAEAEQEPDWSESKTDPSSVWKIPHRPMSERLLKADHAIAFRNEHIEYLKEKLAELRQAIAEAEKQEPVRVTIKDFVKAVEGKEDMVGRPVYWAQWPNDDTHPQPKREPIARVTGVYGGRFIVEPLNPAMVLPTNMALFDEPQPKTQAERAAWVGLTEEEIDLMWKEWKDALCLDHKTWSRAIEAKLKEKNGA